MSEEYPDEEDLKRIRDWDFEQGFVELLEHVRLLWRYADAGYWKRRGRTFWLSTAGWSGNESILEALQENRFFWMMCWESSQRGGHYKFKVPVLKR